jgi:hypothetical protein
MLELLATLALVATEARLETSVSAGAGYETNLNHVDQAALRVGAAFVALRATGGVALDFGERTGLYAGVRLDGEQYPELSDLTTGTLGAEASLVRELGARWAVVLAPSVFRSWSGDAARDVTGVGGQLTLRVKPVPAVALRASYGHTSRDAEDAVFSAERDRAGASVEWRAGERTWLTLGYSAERGDEVTYRPVTETVVTGRMGRQPVSSFGGQQEAYSALAVSHVAAPSLELGLGDAVHLRMTYEFRYVRMWGAASDFQTHSVFAGLGVRR